jgi:AraC-like DNA-binding protein
MNEFQNRARLKRAIWYMKVTPNVKMSALASELGYDRLSEFSRFFRNKTGMTPRAYLDQLIKRGPDDASDEEGR